MNNSKLVHFLKILNEEELKRLLPFLKSPFFNSNQAIVRLYLAIRPYHPGYSSSKLKREHLFKKVFPDRPYNDSKFVNLMSDFLSLIRQFLQQVQLTEQQDLQAQLLLNKLHQSREAKNIFQKQIKKYNKKLDDTAASNNNYYEHKWRLGNMILNHPGTDKFQLSKNQFESNMQQLDHWYLLKKLQLSCEMKAREKPLQEEYHIWLLPQIKETASRIGEEHLLIQFYQLILQLLEEDSTEIYYKLKSLFQKEYHQLNEEVKKDVIQSLINYTIRHGNKGEQHFIKENLELYKLGLSQNWLLEHGVLSDMVYISIVNIALRAGDRIWCNQFINSYATYLPEGSKSDAQNLAMGLWYYAIGQADKALGEIQKVEFLNVYYQIQARVLMIKISFESFQEDDQYFELVHAQLTAFERYLRRNVKLQKQQKLALIHFTSMVKKMTKLGWDQLRKKNLQEEAIRLKPLYNRQWILKQLDH